MGFKEYYNEKEILITGGLGFIGSNLAHELVKLNSKVTIVDSLIPNHGGNLYNIKEIKNKVTVHKTDIRDSDRMELLVKGKDIIFNLAGQVSHIDSMKDPHTDLDINCKSQLSLLESCRKNNDKVKIIFAGTRQIYGTPLTLPVKESHILRPVDVNGINKMAGEWYHILYNNVYGIKTCSLRLINTYGPRQLMKKNTNQGFIPIFIRKIMDGEKISIFEGDQLRDINYVDDVCKAFLLVAADNKSCGQIYNLGHHNPISLEEFVKILIEVNGSGEYEVIPFPKERKKIDIGSIYCDYSKIKKEMGWEPKIDLEEGLRKTINFYKENKKHYW
jgi:UDP-glucose 4-epimerase